MPAYRTPLRDMRFLMNEVLDYPAHYQDGPAGHEATPDLVEAIPELWNLSADEFRQRYAGINATGLGPGDEGWYVRYRHENLTYLFGPLADREEAKRKK